MSAAELKAHHQKRRGVPREVIRELSVIPGIGPSLAADLHLLGIRDVASLKGRSAEHLYEKLCRLVGQRVDRCVLYTFRCAVYFASEKNPESEKLKWWNWMDDSPRGNRPRKRRARES
jgi:hypothetical protein